MTHRVKIVFSAVLAAVVILGLVHLLKETGSFAKNEQPTSTSTEARASDTSKKMPLSKLAFEGETYKCSVSQTAQNTLSTGTVYLDRGLVRGDFTVKYGESSMQSTFIMRDGYTYTWTSAAPTTGVKIKNDTTATVGAAINTPNGFFLDEIGDYSCEAWKADASKFILPTSVTFTAIH